MCLAIHKPAYTNLDKDEMRAAWSLHNDGCGIAYHTAAGVIVKKGLWSFDQFWHEYSLVAKKELLVHFRQASAGVVSQKNCHPFSVHGHAIIHNGHMPQYATRKDCSDTSVFLATMIMPLVKKYPDILLDASFLAILAESIGEDNKLALMHPAGTVALVNGEYGYWDHQDIWYSNDWHCGVFYTEPTQDDLDSLSYQSWLRDNA